MSNAKVKISFFPAPSLSGELAREVALLRVVDVPRDRAERAVVVVVLVVVMVVVVDVAVEVEVVDVWDDVCALAPLASNPIC